MMEFCPICECTVRERYGMRPLAMSEETQKMRRQRIIARA